MTLLITTTTGPVVVQPNDLVITVDESGEHTLTDPKFPIFGLGACAVLGKDYVQELALPWFSMKDEHFGGRLRPLHATDLRKPTSAQLEALNTFFESRTFATIGVFISKSTSIRLTMTEYQSVATAMVALISELLRHIHCTGIVLIVESSQKYDTAFFHTFSKIQLTLKEADSIQNRPIKLLRSVKNSAVPSLEVADFIAHTGGCVTRAQANGDVAPDRPDMNAVFGEYGPFSQYVHLTDVGPGASDWTPSAAPAV